MKRSDMPKTDTISQMLRDPEIRKELRRRLTNQYGGDRDVVIVDEFTLPGARIDLAVINGRLMGYEIKSAADNLDRLKLQVPAYGAIFDEVTVLASECHLNELLAHVPAWWGVMLPVAHRNRIVMRRVRSGTLNLRRKPEQLARLLRRNEAAEALRHRGLHHGLSRASAAQVLQRVHSTLTLDEIADAVRAAIKRRPPRPELPSQDGGLCTIAPTAQDHRRNFEWLLSLRSPHRQR
jgi:hypothetical protein